MEIHDIEPARIAGARYKVAEIKPEALLDLKIPLRARVQGEEAELDAIFRDGDRLLLRARIIPADSATDDPTPGT